MCVWDFNLANPQGGNSNAVIWQPASSPVVDVGNHGVYNNQGLMYFRRWGRWWFEFDLEIRGGSAGEPSGVRMSLGWFNPSQTPNFWAQSGIPTTRGYAHYSENRAANGSGDMGLLPGSDTQGYTGTIVTGRLRMTAHVITPPSSSENNPPSQIDIDRARQELANLRPE
jgi:hypothetical protein